MKRNAIFAYRKIDVLDYFKLRCMQYFLFFAVLWFSIYTSEAQTLPVWNGSNDGRYAVNDWLIKPITEKAEIYFSSDGKEVVLYNGLVKRTFRITPDVACVDYINMIDGRQILRAIKPEARINLNGIDYNVGGLYGQKENAYIIREWVDQLKKGKDGFHYVSYEITDIRPFINTKFNYWAGNTRQTTGKMITFHYRAEALKGVELAVHYELYDGIPVICKWLSVENKTGQSVQVNRVVNEILAVVEEQSAVVGDVDKMAKPASIYIETNYAYNNAMRYDLSDQTTHWKRDCTYTSQVNYDYNTPCLLEVYPEKAPNITLEPGEIFRSVRSYELLMDSYDRERRGLAIRRMYRTIAPWTTGNPIFMHLVSRNDEQVYTAIDQCVATGYEALILSFGSHLSMEKSSPENYEKWKKIADYAHQKGIKIGGYTLFSSRRIGPDTDVIDPKTGKPGGAFFGNAPCFCSRWGLDYRDHIIAFFENTGFDILEMDGPYPGDVCASTNHPGHKGLDDSQWRQMEMQKSLFHWMATRGVYVNAPDWYFLDGTNKIGLGYREANFSLSRAQQKILNRQNIFDGTWEKLPAMGWGFVPLTIYQGGGAESILEPLCEHLKDYEQLMAQYYGAGIQACYRGPRLYDTEETKQVVIAMIAWYKKYRDILNSDIIHLRRADGRDWDGILHVNPELKEKGLLMLYNPLDKKITRTIKLPLYYTGLNRRVKIREKENRLVTYTMNRDYTVDFTFTLEPDTYSWFVIE